MPIGSEGMRSPVFRRRDTAEFTIPKCATTPPARHRCETDIKWQSMPTSAQVKSISLDNISLINQKSIGQICIELWYSQDDELLVVKLQRVDLLAKPNSAVICSNWNFEPVVKICFYNKKQKSWEHSKRSTAIKPHAATYIPLKKLAVQEQSLLLIVFDEMRQNDQIPIGHVFIPLKDIDLSWKASTYVREIVPSSEPGGFSTGRAEVKCLWVSSKGKLRIRVGQVKKLKSPRGTLRRLFFIKIFVFIGDSEVKRWKSQPKLANPDLNFDDEFSVDIDPPHITNCSFLVQVFAKPRERLHFTAELVGATLIGPYMPKELGSFTQWENMIAKPFEEIVDNHELYL